MQEQLARLLDRMDDGIDSRFRIKGYFKGGLSFVTGQCSYEYANRLLDQMFNDGMLMGGHIEERIDGVGWSVYYPGPCFEPL